MTKWKIVAYVLLNAGLAGLLRATAGRFDHTEVWAMLGFAGWSLLVLTTYHLVDRAYQSWRKDPQRKKSLWQELTSLPPLELDVAVVAGLVASPILVMAALWITSWSQLRVLEAQTAENRKAVQQVVSQADILQQQMAEVSAKHMEDRRQAFADLTVRLERLIGRRGELDEGP